MGTRRPRSWGTRQQMLLRGREGDVREEKGTWHLGEVEKWALPRPQSERTEQRNERSESPRTARPGHNSHLRLRKTG